MMRARFCLAGGSKFLAFALEGGPPRKALIAAAYLQFRGTWRGPARSAWQALRTVSDRHPPTPVTVSWCVRRHHAVGLV